MKIMEMIRPSVYNPEKQIRAPMMLPSKEEAVSNSLAERRIDPEEAKAVESQKAGGLMIPSIKLTMPFRLLQFGEEECR
jgi:hypothetical protein